MSTSKLRAGPEVEDLVRLYLKDVGRFPLLSKMEEVRLAQQIEAGNAARAQLTDANELPPLEERELRRTARQGEAAQLTFVQSNLRLVVSIARRYQASGLPLLDLIQEGNFGLMRAVEKFDWRRDFRFSTYATWWIRETITRGISNTSRTIRLPVHAGDTLARVRAARSRVELNRGRPATVAEIAVELEIPEDKVMQALRFEAAPVSLTEPVSEESSTELGDLIEDDAVVSPLDAAMLALLRIDVATMLGVLDERERRIISLRFGFDRGEPRTLEEVGEFFNLTRERIRQIEAGAMLKLRRPGYEEAFRSHLDA